LKKCPARGRRSCSAHARPSTRPESRKWIAWRHRTASLCTPARRRLPSGRSPGSSGCRRRDAVAKTGSSRSGHGRPAEPRRQGWGGRRRLDGGYVPVVRDGTTPGDRYGGAESNHAQWCADRLTATLTGLLTAVLRRARGTQWKGLRAFGNSQQHSQQHSQDFSPATLTDPGHSPVNGGARSNRRAHDRLSGGRGSGNSRRISPPVSVAVSVAVRSSCESLAQHGRRPRKGATKVRNEEPTRSSDPPPGFTGDLAADVGTSLGGMRVHPSGGSRTSGARRARSLRWCSRVSPARGGLRRRALRAPGEPGHVELRRLCGRRAERAQARPKGVEYYVSYAGRGTEGYWLGKAAASLGLVGAVDPAAFRALAKGEHPDGGRLLERVATDHTPGWDITLSAPKSVSLAWATRRRTLRAALAKRTARQSRRLLFPRGRGRPGTARVRGRDGHVPAGLASPALSTPPRESSIRSSTRMGSVCNVVEGSDGRWTARLPHDLPAPDARSASIYRAELRERIASSAANGSRRIVAACPSSRASAARCCGAFRSGGTRSRRSSSAPGDRAEGASGVSEDETDKLDVELVELREPGQVPARSG